MDSNTIGAYSPDIVYGQLTYPFTPKNVSINAHTPYDKEDESGEKAVSLKNFVHDAPKSKYASMSNDKYQFGLDTNYKPSQLETPEEYEFPPKGINNFSKSKLSSKDIVKGAIDRGYSADQAITVVKARNAYTNSPLERLNTHTYTVS